MTFKRETSISIKRIEGGKKRRRKEFQKNEEAVKVLSEICRLNAAIDMEGLKLN